MLGLLDRPAIFHAARFALVGHQAVTKRLVREHLAATPEATVLDVCCGVGEFAPAVTGRYVGVDANPRFIAEARRRHAGQDSRRFEVGDVLRLDYPPHHFDSTIVVNSLHHFSDAEATRLLAEVRRLTRRLVLVIDADGTPRGLLRRVLLGLDRGRFMRTPARLAGVVGAVLPIAETVAFRVGLYDEVLLRCPLR